METISYSIRTSGEVVSVIIREIIVIYVSLFFIGANLQLIFNKRQIFPQKSNF